MIEANKEEAEKCLKIGEAALQAGDLNKAFRFVSKAQKLYITDQVRWQAARGGPRSSALIAKRISLLRALHNPLLQQRVPWTGV